jgi:hypothetical protein
MNEMYVCMYVIILIPYKRYRADVNLVLKIKF